MNNKNLFHKRIKILGLSIVVEKFRFQNKYLNLPHKLFKPGVHYYVTEENNKLISIVIKNYRLMFVF